MGVVMVYSVLYGFGEVLFGSLLYALITFALAIVLGIGISRNLARSGWGVSA
jgi:hypothetical protein